MPGRITCASIWLKPACSPIRPASRGIRMPAGRRIGLTSTTGPERELLEPAGHARINRGLGELRQQLLRHGRPCRAGRSVFISSSAGALPAIRRRARPCGPRRGPGRFDVVFGIASGLRSKNRALVRNLRGPERNKLDLDDGTLGDLEPDPGDLEFRVDHGNAPSGALDVGLLLGAIEPEQRRAGLHFRAQPDEHLRHATDGSGHDGHGRK